MNVIVPKSYLDSLEKSLEKAQEDLRRLLSVSKFIQQNQVMYLREEEIDIPAVESGFVINESLVGVNGIAKFSKTFKTWFFRQTVKPRHEIHLSSYELLRTLKKGELFKQLAEYGKKEADFGAVLHILSFQSEGRRSGYLHADGHPNYVIMKSTKPQRQGDNRSKGDETRIVRLVHDTHGWNLHECSEHDLILPEKSRIFCA
ncbi:MAG: hypothetical protein WCO84_03345 [bacterium]